MLLHRLLAWCALGAAGTACGAAPEPVARQSQAAASLRFVKPPVAIYNTEFGYLDVWVRLNRGLRQTVGTPGDYAGQPGSIQVAGTLPDVPGLEGNPLRPTCYTQSLDAGEAFAQLPAGTAVEVTLALDATHKITATASLQLYDDDADRPRPAEALHCPSRERGRPRPQRCQGNVSGEQVEIGLVSARGTSCRRAREVLVAVGRHASGRCYRDLCVHRHPRNHGFRCSAGLSGEAAWDIVCRRGDVEVRGFAAD